MKHSVLAQRMTANQSGFATPALAVWQGSKYLEPTLIEGWPIPKTSLFGYVRKKVGTIHTLCHNVQ